MLQSLTRKAKLLLDHRSYPSHPGTAIANVSQPGKGPELRMALLPTTVLTPLLALLSLYAAQKSYIAITNLQKYEERTEKAAKYLDKAEHDLYKTRVTQASGAAAVCIPLSSSQFLYCSFSISYSKKFLLLQCQDVGYCCSNRSAYIASSRPTTVSNTYDCTDAQISHFA